MAGIEVIDALRAALSDFQAQRNAAILEGLQVYESLALRYAVTEGMITGGGKDAPVNATKITVRTGRLRRALSMAGPAATGGDTFTAGLAIDTDAAPYGPIQEFGGQTSPHEIIPKNAKALHWSVGGADVFAKKVNHPGSNIPARPYMSPSLAATLQAGLDAIEGRISDLAARTLGSVA